MKPGYEKDVVLILDSIPELGVVLNAIRDPDFNPSPQCSWHPTAVNFLKSTRIQPEPVTQPTGRGPVILDKERWAPDPKFEVRDADTDFVLTAARRTIEEKRVIPKVRDIASKRYTAAKRILLLLET
jgi:hypothetical protein